MDDLFRMMPHAKSDSKMQKKESLFAVNEIAEMKNCSRVLLVEGRRKRDVFLWAGIVARGPSVKFEVEKQRKKQNVVEIETDCTLRWRIFTQWLS